MMLTKTQIKDVIPHREPFLLIDEVEAIEPGKSIRAKTHVDADASYFKGHFPDFPVMPGVLIVEALAQAGAVLLLREERFKGRKVLFAGLDDCRFKRMVKPGDTLTLHVELTKMRGVIGKADAIARVGDELACKATMTFAVAPD